MAPGIAVSSVSSSRRRAGDVRRVARIASATRRSGPSVATASVRKPWASPVSEVDSSGAPHPSTAVDLDGLAGQLGEARGDPLLERVVRRPVGRGVPSVDDAGEQHRGVLAGAVHGQGAGLLAGPDRRDLGVVVERVVRRGLQRVHVEVAEREDPADAVEVERLAAVRGAGQREQLRRQVEAEPDHARAPGAACCTSAAAPARSTSPTDHAVVPSAASATTEPWWWPSTKPERTTSATTTGAGTRDQARS